ncbi:caspase recruitment domain family, member 19 isoform X1 [Polypterus senegalus]|uniref:caspase recruitment domain family, member 19 isoform X1 n=1 Tax=Polypterus senegalus TaxID=55291 RepID=UPI0019626CFC|nr:caspase recruitment domain family, member 19 isoform X1 [Polypterus senegalus]
MSDSYRDQLLLDALFLKQEHHLSTDLLDKLVLQLNRIYPQILTDKEAHKFRSLKFATNKRLAELLDFLPNKGEEACHEFYRALQIHAEHIYLNLPSRRTRRDAADSKEVKMSSSFEEKCVLNERGPVFYITCFSLVAGLAFLYYCNEENKTLGDAKQILAFSALGFGRRAKDLLISYAEDQFKQK